MKVARPEKVSQSLLARMDVCGYSGALYLQHKGGAQTAPMSRGTIFHEFVERAILTMVDTGEVQLPPEVARELLEAVVEEREDLTLPAHERDSLRGMAWKWAESFTLNPKTLAGVEVMPELEIDGWIVRGKIDLVEQHGDQVWIRDWKTSLAIPSQEDFDRSFQTRFYALLWAEGTLDGKRPGQGVNTFHLAEEYPRYEGEDGLFRRVTTVAREDLHDFKRHISGLLRRLESSVESGEWTVSPGSHCATCSAPRECPLPSSQIPVVFEEESDAREAAEELDRLEAKAKEIKAALREWVDGNGELVYGDQEWGFRAVRSNRTDKGAMEEALRAGGADPNSFIKTSTTTRFQRRKVKG